MDKDLHIGVAVLVFNREGKVLLGKRLSEMGHGMYQAPGGHAEPNESFEKTADREVYEETGLETHGIQFLCYQDNYFEAKDKWYRTFFYTAFLDYPDAQPQNMEPEKNEGWDWYDINDLPQPMFEWNEETLFLARRKWSSIFESDFADLFYN